MNYIILLFLTILFIIIILSSKYFFAVFTSPPAATLSVKSVKGLAMLNVAGVLEGREHGYFIHVCFLSLFIVLSLLLTPNYFFLSLTHPSSVTNVQVYSQKSIPRKHGFCLNNYIQEMYNKRT